MYEQIIAQLTPELQVKRQQLKERYQRNLDRMIKFMNETLKPMYPTLKCDDSNAAILLDIAEMVKPCEKCTKRVCERNHSKLVTIDEISLYKGYISPRTRPNCREINYYPTFAMLVHTIHEETTTAT